MVRLYLKLAFHRYAGAERSRRYPWAPSGECEDLRVAFLVQTPLRIVHESGLASASSS